MVSWDLFIVADQIQSDCHQWFASFDFTSGGVSGNANVVNYGYAVYPWVLSRNWTCFIPVSRREIISCGLGFFALLFIHLPLFEACFKRQTWCFLRHVSHWVVIFYHMSHNKYCALPVESLMFLNTHTHCPLQSSLGYPDSVRWQHFQAPQLRLGQFMFYIRAALPQIRVETLIGSQANYEIQIKIPIYFYKIIISYEKYSTLNLY